MKAVEASAKTREQAIQNALKELGVEMYEVDKIEVIDEGSKGLFGLGSRPVRVRLVVESLHDEPQRDTEAESRSRRGGRGRGERTERGERGEARGERSGGRGGRGEKRDGRNGREAGGERAAGATKEAGPAKSDERKPRPPREPRKREERGDKPAETQARRGERDAQRPRPERKRPRPSAERDVRTSPAAGGEGGEADRPREFHEERADQPAVDTTAPITDAQGNEAATLLEEIIAKMGIAATASFVRTDDGSARINVASEDSAILIGRKGRNLSALQYLINRMISQGDTNENTERIVLDVEGYVDRRRESLQELALSMASRAKETQRNMRLKPLSPQERRIIHVTLQDDEDIRTFSLGESLFRSVVISPKNATRPERSRSGRGSRGGRRRGGRGRSAELANKNESTEPDVGAFGD